MKSQSNLSRTSKFRGAILRIPDMYQTPVLIQNRFKSQHHATEGNCRPSPPRLISKAPQNKCVAALQTGCANLLHSRLWLLTLKRSCWSPCGRSPQRYQLQYRNHLLAPFLTPFARFPCRSRPWKVSARRRGGVWRRLTHRLQAAGWHRLRR